MLHGVGLLPLATAVIFPVDVEAATVKSVAIANAEPMLPVGWMA
jgi:hypothetical protein